jgi:hypothetical protein
MGKGRGVRVGENKGASCGVAFIKQSHNISCDVSRWATTMPTFPLSEFGF